MYAIVKTGGKQYKVAEGDVIEVEKLEGEPGHCRDLARAAAGRWRRGHQRRRRAGRGQRVPARSSSHGKGEKIVIHKFKNKTGYHKRQGHRQPLTKVKVTGISAG